MSFTNRYQAEVPPFNEEEALQVSCRENAEDISPSELEENGVVFSPSSTQMLTDEEVGTFSSQYTTY